VRVAVKVELLKLCTGIQMLDHTIQLPQLERQEDWTGPQVLA
jgi:hypothetical protein